MTNKAISDTSVRPDNSVLVTGGAGFFGSLLVQRLLESGYDCVCLDLHQPELSHSCLTVARGDLRDKAFVTRVLQSHRFRTIFHCAAALAHDVKDQRFLWESNVDGTRNLVEVAAATGVQSMVFTSSNCLWASNLGRPVSEDDEPRPVEIYGQSKWEGEKILSAFSDMMKVSIIRCPTIIDEGRLGLLTLLFEFIAEGRKIWTIGGGHNRYQFIYAQDLVNACLMAANHACSRTFNVGSDNVPTLRETYQYVIDRAGTRSRIVTIPKQPSLFLLRLAHLAKLSPLGPYHYRMIAEDFVFDTSRIKHELGWMPTLTNGEMLWRAYRYFQDNRQVIAARQQVSAHRQSARMGVLRLLKWLS